MSTLYQFPGKRESFECWLWIEELF